MSSVAEEDTGIVDGEGERREWKGTKGAAQHHRGEAMWATATVRLQAKSARLRLRCRIVSGFRFVRQTVARARATRTRGESAPGRRADTRSHP